MIRDNERPNIADRPYSSIITVSRVASLLFLIVLSLSNVQTCWPKATQNVVSEESLAKFLREYVHELGVPDDRTTRYIHALADLDNDGSNEVVVYLMGQGWCGSGGCRLVVLKQRGDTFIEVSHITVVRAPIQMLKSRTKGWRDLTVWVQGGSPEPGYHARLKFDGVSYPLNPSVPPAERMEQAPGGQVLIPESGNFIRNGTPLFP